MSDKIPVAFPTAGAARAKSRNRGEKAPVVFVVPKGVHVGGTNIGSMKTRVDVSAYGAYDPDEPFCETFIDPGETELFAIGDDRRSKTTLKVDSAELAAALEDWRAQAGMGGGWRIEQPPAKPRRPDAPAEPEAPSEGGYADRGDLDRRIEAAYRASALLERERAEARRKRTS